MTLSYDIAIVGAGPAGSAAAYFLAAHGFNVALIDKARFPRDKTCGDGVSPRALHVLNQIGVLDDLKARAHTVNKLDLYAPDGTLCVADVPRMEGFPHYTLIAPRFVLDDCIRRRALEAGAKPVHADVIDVIRDGARIVGVQTRGGDIRAKLTVIATGAATRLLEQCGLLRRKPVLMVAARQYFSDLPLQSDHLEFYFNDVVLPGYGWLFPTSSSTANIGIGYLGGQAASPRSLLEKMLSQHPRVSQLVKHAKPGGVIKGYPLRVDFHDSEVMVDGALGIGEAIGLVNPFTGEGIDYALESGQIAAECIARAADLSPNGLRHYPQVLDARFKHMFRIITQMRNIFYNTFMLNRLFGRGATNRHLRETIMDICFGESDPLNAFTPTMLWEMLKPL